MRRFVLLALFALVLGAGVLTYRGPGRGFVRGHLGDVGATMLVYAVLGAMASLAPRRARWIGRPSGRVVATLGIATALELGQLVWTGTGIAGELVVGGSFDGWDFAAYLAGTLLARAYDGWPRPRELLRPIHGLE